MNSGHVAPESAITMLSHLLARCDLKYNSEGQGTITPAARRQQRTRSRSYSAQATKTFKTFCFFVIFKMGIITSDYEYRGRMQL